MMMTALIIPFYLKERQVKTEWEESKRGRQRERESERARAPDLGVTKLKFANGIILVTLCCTA
jgi:hypothetical protein